MRLRIVAPLSGTLDWRALQGFDPFLVRRMGDRGQLVIGAGARAVLDQQSAPGGVGAFQGFRAFGGQYSHDWVFGHLAYDLKNEVEALASRHPDRMGFGLAHWFVPRFVVVIEERMATLHVEGADREEGEAWLHRLLMPADGPEELPSLAWELKTSKEDYLQRARRMLGHIQRGDVYEVNYCTERTAKAMGWDPFAAFERIMRRLDPPHAAFYRVGDRYAICASPERFLRFEGTRVIAQPMKGTRPRSADPVKDLALARELATDAKERSENIMAVDVMRNDLSRVARSRSVRVDELCTVKSHPAVHQMISTVSAELREGLHPRDAVRAAWPMASMTGAPKVSAMRLIDEVEDMRRGLFSGSLGFFSPDGVADLNVVIRTVQYNAATGEASLITGSALTAACDPAKEWEECELKARSVINALNDDR